MSGANRAIGAAAVAVVGIGSLLFLSSRARSAVSGATQGAFDFTSEDNVINTSVEHVTGFSLTRFGHQVGGFVYDITRGDNTPADWLGLK